MIRSLFIFSAGNFPVDLSQQNLLNLMKLGRRVNAINFDRCIHSVLTVAYLLNSRTVGPTDRWIPGRALERDENKVPRAAPPFVRRAGSFSCGTFTSLLMQCCYRPYVLSRRPTV
jgi:hypothetical protein